MQRKNGRRVRIMAYFGEYYHNIDQSSRLTVPARFRDEMGDEVVLYKAPEGCLFVYDNEKFRAVTAQLGELSNTPAGRQKMRRFYADVTVLSVDRTGRFIIPSDYMSYAGLEDEVVVLGADTRLEIWSRKVFDSTFGNTDEAPLNEYPQLYL